MMIHVLNCLDIPAMCDVDSERVNLLNDVIIPYKLDSCLTVISKDCSPKEKYALKAKKIDHPKYKLVSWELYFNYYNYVLLHYWIK